MAEANGRAEWGRWLVREWTGKLTEILESMTGARPRVDWRPAAAGANPEVEAAALAAQQGPVLWWEQAFSTGAKAVFSIAAPETAWKSLGQQILAAAGVEDADPAEARSTFLELAGQSLDGVAGAVGTQLAREVNCPQRSERSEAPSGGECFVVEVISGEGAPLVLLAVPAPELANAMAPPPVEASQGAEPQAAPPAAQQSFDTSPMLDLLLDVELPVSISFGRTQLALKEALRLTTGSIVELNRASSEPVEVIVNNCVIARGDVVVIEGNYGVRIREIMSRDARIRNLSR